MAQQSAEQGLVNAPLTCPAHLLSPVVPPQDKAEAAEQLKDNSSPLSSYLNRDSIQSAENTPCVLQTRKLPQHFYSTKYGLYFL